MVKLITVHHIPTPGTLCQAGPRRGVSLLFLPLPDTSSDPATFLHQDMVNLGRETASLPFGLRLQALVDYGIHSEQYCFVGNYGLS